MTDNGARHRGDVDHNEPTVIIATDQLPKWLTQSYLHGLRDAAVIIGGIVTISSQIWVKVVQHEDPSAILVVAGGIMLGVVLPGFWVGDRRGSP